VSGQSVILVLVVCMTRSLPDSSSLSFRGDELPTMQWRIGDASSLLLLCRSGEPDCFLNQRGEVMGCVVKGGWRVQSFI